MGRHSLTKIKNEFGLNANEEQCAILWSSGLFPTKAAVYLAVFGQRNKTQKAIRNAASDLFKRPHVVEYVEHLQEEGEKDAKVTRNSLARDVVRLRAKAETVGAFGPATQCNAQLAKMFGLEQTKVEHSGGVGQLLVVDTGGVGVPGSEA